VTHPGRAANIEVALVSHHGFEYHLFVLREQILHILFWLSRLARQGDVQSADHLGIVHVSHQVSIDEIIVFLSAAEIEMSLA
jgi:hypothetical protein